MPFPQDKYAGSMSDPEFTVRVAYMRKHGLPSMSEMQVRRARRVLVFGIPVQQLAEEEGISRFTLYKPIRAIAKAQRRGPSR